MNKKVLNSTTLLEFLQENFTDYSKKDIKNFLKYKSVLVNNKIVTKYDYILKVNDIVSINKYNKDDNIKILYEDEYLIIVDKPTNILVVDAPNNKDKTLYNLVSEYVKKKNKNNKIFIVHRLDYETSGVIIFAKTMDVKTKLQDNWDSLVLKRKYIALVNGKVGSGTFKSNLKENKNHYVYESKFGKEAITIYNTIKTNNKYSLVDIEIKTGRKNQIRVQFSSNNTPIVGDLKYGYKDLYHNRLCLHAYAIEFINPITNKTLKITSPVPKSVNI